MANGKRNRVGDAGFILGLLILFAYFGTFNFQEVFAQVRSPDKDTRSQEHRAKPTKLGRAGGLFAAGSNMITLSWSEQKDRRPVLVSTGVAIKS